MGICQVERGFQGSASHGNNKWKCMRCHIREAVTSLTKLDDRLLEIGKRGMDQITKIEYLLYFRIDVGRVSNRF